MVEHRCMINTVEPDLEMADMVESRDLGKPECVFGMLKQG